MAIPKTEEYIFYQGEIFQVEFYFDETGELPAKEYLEYPRQDKSLKRVRMKLATLVKLIAEEGKVYDKTKFRLEDAKERIFAFKPLGHRFFNFFYKGGKIIITNAYKKKSQKVDRQELERAVSMKKDYFRRVKGGMYYEKEKS